MRGPYSCVEELNCNGPLRHLKDKLSGSFKNNFAMSFHLNNNEMALALGLWKLINRNTVGEIFYWPKFGQWLGPPTTDVHYPFWLCRRGT